MATFYNFTENGNVYSFDDIFVTKNTITDGSLFSWGYNFLGSIGDNTTIDRSTPRQEITTSTEWKRVSICHNGAVLAIKSDGTLWSWGQNTQGQLGDNTATTRSTPRQISIADAGGLTGWKQVSGGAQHSAAIRNDGSLWVWGQNNYGQIGDNTTAISRLTPRQISIANGGGIYGWKQVECGATTTHAIRTDGTLWSWGRNTFGSIGDNTQGSSGVNSRSTPRQISIADAGGLTGWKQVSASHNLSTYAIRDDGSLWAWGTNNNALGDNTIAARSTPRQISIADAGGLTGWKQVSGGNGHTVAIRTDGTLWGWGSNLSGQVGDNTTIDRSTPRREYTASTNWKDCVAGGSYVISLKNNGTLWAWGNNGNGQLGDNTTGVNRLTPRQEITSRTNWKSITSSSNTVHALIYNI